MDTAQQAIITAEGLQALLDALQRRGYRVVGPTVRDQAIVYDDIDRLPICPRDGLTSRTAGSYRLARRDDDALFGYAVGPHSWKRFLHPPVLRLWQASATRRDGVVTGARAAERGSPSSACAPANCMRSPSRIGCSWRALRRPALPGAPRRRLHRCRELRPGRRHLLLRVDEHWPEGGRWFRSRADRAAR